MKNIEWSGNTERFCGQKKGKLVDVQRPLAKTISPALIEHVGKNIPEKSVRQFIVCTYIGESGIPFVDTMNYGGGRFEKLEKSIGQWFDIDVPVQEEQTEIELKAQEVSE